MTSHIKVSYKLDMLGIGAAHQGDPNGIAWKQNRDFEILLKRLNGDLEGAAVEGFRQAENFAEDLQDGEREKKRKKEKENGEGARKKKKKKDTDEEESGLIEPSIPVAIESVVVASKSTRSVPRHRSYVFSISIF